MRGATERGTRKPYPNIRVGVSTPRLLGIQRKPDPSAVRDEAFWEIVNGRLLGGRLVNRGGQEKVNTGGVTDGCPELIFDGGDIGAREPEALPPSEGIWGVGYTNGSWNQLGQIGFHLNTSMDPDLQDFLATSETDTDGADAMAIAYVAAHDALYYISEGGESLVGNVVQIWKVTLPSHLSELFCELPLVNVLAMPDAMSYGSNLFVIDSVSNLAASDVAKVYQVSSTGTVALEDTPAESVRGAVMGTFGTDLYVAYNNNLSDSNNALIKKRTSGGTWSSLGSPGVNDIAIYDLIEFNSKLWLIGIEGANVYLISYDGAAFTTERTIAPAGGTNLALCALTTFNSCLYFTYRATTGATAILGKFDGAVWTDIEYSDAAAAFIDIGEFGGSLYILASGELFVSDGTDTTSFSSAFSPFFPGVRPHISVVIP